MKTPVELLLCLVASALLGGCASAPATHHVTLDDGRPRTAKTSVRPSIAVVRVDVPERIDRPQLVLRTAANQVTLSEHYRWAEPLRREIPRVIASDLGELLDSSHVAALPAGGFDADFKVTLDFQQLEAIVGQGVEVDVLWRIESRGGMVSVGRSSFRQPLDEAKTSADLLPLVAAQRQALRLVAADVAEVIAAHSNDNKLSRAAPMP